MHVRINLGMKKKHEKRTWTVIQQLIINNKFPKPSTTLDTLRRDPSKMGVTVPVGTITVLSLTSGTSYGYALFSDKPNTVVAGTGGTGYVNTNKAKGMENTAVSRDADRKHVKRAPDEPLKVKKHRDHCKTHEETGKLTDGATTVIVDYMYVTTIVDVTITGKYAPR